MIIPMQVVDFVRLQAYKFIDLLCCIHITASVYLSECFSICLNDFRSRFYKSFISCLLRIDNDNIFHVFAISFSFWIWRYGVQILTVEPIKSHTHTLPMTRHRCSLEMWVLAQSHGDTHCSRHTHTRSRVPVLIGYNGDLVWVNFCFCEKPIQFLNTADMVKKWLRKSECHVQFIVLDYLAWKSFLSVNQISVHVFIYFCYSREKFIIFNTRQQVQQNILC